MEDKLKTAFDRVTMPDQCAKDIKSKLCKPAEERRGYYAAPVQPTKGSWVKGIAAAAVLVILCCVFLPAGLQNMRRYTQQDWVELCRAALVELQNRESVHLTTTVTVEGIPGETGADNQYWQQGSTWLRIGEMNFEARDNDYVVGNLCVDEIQYRFGFAGNYDRVVKPNWTVAEQPQCWEKLWLMEFDISDASILSAEGESTAEGTMITTVFVGNPRPESDTVYENCTMTWYLDKNGKLYKVTESALYSKEYQGELCMVTATAEIDVQTTDSGEIEQVLTEALEEAKRCLKSREDEHEPVLEQVQEQLAGENDGLDEPSKELAPPGYANALKLLQNGLSYPVGSILYTYSGWGNSLSVVVNYDTSLHTPWTRIQDGRVIFTLDKTIDITDQFSEEEPFIYIYTDIYCVTHYIAIGGTAGNPGYLEMRKLCWETDMYEGNLGGFGANTWNSETESSYAWVQRAKDIFEPYGVYWVS